MGRILANPRHELFIREYLKEMAVGGTATAAYKKVYKGCKGFNCANAAAWTLLHKPKIQSRIKEMRMDIKRKADISFEKILTDYQEALDMARSKESPAEMISAAREQAKLVGLLIDRKEVGSAGDFESMESISQILEAVALQAGPEAALALSQVFKLIPPVIIKTAEPEESQALFESESPSDAVN